MPHINKLKKITFNNKDYLLDLKTNNIYDLHLAKKGMLFLVGKLSGYPKKPGKKLLFVRLADSPPRIVDSIKQILGKKLDDINRSNYSKFIEKEFAPEGPGYLIAKKRFEKHQNTRRAKSLTSKRSKSRSKSKSKSKSGSRKQRPKTIGG